MNWPDCAPAYQYVMLKAAVAAAGSALTLFEEVNPLSGHNGPGVHQTFLVRLKSGVAGGLQLYRSLRGWFSRTVVSGGGAAGMGLIGMRGDDAWRDTTELYAQAATPEARYLGAGAFSASQSFRTSPHLLRSCSGKRRRDGKAKRCAAA